MTMPTTTCGYSYESDARLSFLASSNRRYNVQDVLSLLGNSDIDLSDSDDEVGDGASDPGEISASSESSSSSDQSDVVQPPPAQRRKLYRKTRVHNPPLKPAVTVNDRSQEHANWTPLDYFDSYIDDDILDVMADMTNRHHLQQTGATLHTSTVEVNKWIGMSIMMGCMNLKRIRLYWQRSTRVPSIANCMTRNRFFKLRNHLTVVDNNSVSDDDKAADRMWKVRPFIERVRKTCLKLEKDQDVCIDEQMISFTGRCPARQYVPRKPSPTGLKNFVLAGASGIVYDFSLYHGAGMYTNYVLGQYCGCVNRSEKDIAFSVTGSSPRCPLSPLYRNVTSIWRARSPNEMFLHLSASPVICCFLDRDAVLQSSLYLRTISPSSNGMTINRSSWLPRHSVLNQRAHAPVGVRRTRWGSRWHVQLLLRPTIRAWVGSTCAIAWSHTTRSQAARGDGTCASYFTSWILCSATAGLSGRRTAIRACSCTTFAYQLRHAWWMQQKRVMTTMTSGDCLRRMLSLGYPPIPTAQVPPAICQYGRT